MFRTAEIQPQHLLCFRSGIAYHLNKWTAEIQRKHLSLFYKGVKPLQTVRLGNGRLEARTEETEWISVVSVQRPVSNWLKWQIAALIIAAPRHVILSTFTKINDTLFPLLMIYFSSIKPFSFISDLTLYFSWHWKNRKDILSTVSFPLARIEKTIARIIFSMLIHLYKF